MIDACNSGTLLVKSEAGWLPETKHGFKNLIQIASCLDSQNSLAGNPLSVFTERFRAAALRKTEGVVFYTDIISTLRDTFIDNDSQTPFFVSQHTGRERFVDDAKYFDALRSVLEKIRAADVNKIQDADPPLPAPLTLLDRLRAADSKVVNPDIMASFVGRFFDDLVENISTSEFSDFFECEITEHTRFEESTAESFIIRVMVKEKRSDNFVTAHHSRRFKSGNAMLGSLTLDPFEDVWELSLNCAMERAQLRIAFTPKFINLQRIVLVVSCAPSLDYCYIFEISTQHLLHDFGRFDSDGPEISRRWWKMKWADSADGVVSQISGKISETVREHLENAERRLSR